MPLYFYRVKFAVAHAEKCPVPNDIRTYSGGSAMTRQHRRLIYLVNDPICLVLMARDGILPRAVYRMMKSVRPMIAQPAEVLG